MSDPFLIFHRVRGEPAFDIAIKLEDIDDDGESIWIIPTSGHRAHPFAHWELNGLGQDSDCGFPTWAAPTMPPGWPDHYPSRAAPSIDIRSVLTALTKSSEPVERRF